MFGGLRRIVVNRALTATVARPADRYHPTTKSEFEYDLRVTDPKETEPIGVYRVMERDASIKHSSHDPNFKKEEAIKMYEHMIQLNQYDRVMYDAQRQGRISFYMQNHGEEAAQIGSVAALSPNDLIYAQYREAGVIFWRGYTLQQAIDQCYGNTDDIGAGRQMPVHYGSRDLGYVTISSPLTTQLPQAAGSAYALKRAGEKRVVICYFGEGAASEGDAHAAFNFASTLNCPVIWFCRNNGFAISTPIEDQYSGDGIASRAPGYGMIYMRVDGNDLMAVFNATSKARQIALEENRPVLIEAMTYRQGHHSTSDDSSRYRSVDEVNMWAKTDNPISRWRQYLFKQGWWTEAQDEELAKKYRKEILGCLVTAEAKKKPSIASMFEDVYQVPTDDLNNQHAELLAHLKEYGDKYDLSKFAE